MATLHQLLCSVQREVRLVTSGLAVGNTPVDVQVGIDWPPVRTLQQSVKMAPLTSLVSVFDRKNGHDSTRWGTSVLAESVTQTQLVSSPDLQIVDPIDVGTITLSGVLTSGDAVSLVAVTWGCGPDPDSGVTPGTPARAVVASWEAGDTLDTLAQRLATLVSQDVLGLGQWLSVAAAGPVLTLTCLIPSSLRVGSYTGNGGTQIMEIGRRRRDVQVTVWAPSIEARGLVSDPIELLMARMEVFSDPYQAGLTLTDGSLARILAVNDFLIDDAVLSDIYRHDFIVSADYPITSTDFLYSVLAPITTYNII